MKAGEILTYNYYAIVTNDYKKAAEWFQNKNHDKIARWIPTHLMFVMKNGDKYKILTRPEQADGYSFMGIEIDPTYTDLLTEVKKRLING